MSIYQDPRFCALMDSLEPSLKKQARKKAISQKNLTEKIRELLAEKLTPSTQREIEGMLGFFYKSTDVSSALAKMVRRGEVIKQVNIKENGRPTPVNFYCLDIYRSKKVKNLVDLDCDISEKNKKSWPELRYQVLKESSGKCCLCGSSAKDGAVLQVDHIKPKSLYPELEFEKSNLQVLCSICNFGKLNKDETDWR